MREGKEQPRMEEVERVRFAIAFEGPERYAAERVGAVVDRIRRELAQ